MKELQTLSEEQKDLIKAQVGGSKLYLKAISFHRAFNPIYNILKDSCGEKYTMELSTFVACFISSIKKGDVGLTYSRGRNTYTKFNKTIINRDPSSYKRTIELFDLLELNGFIYLYKGYKDVLAGDSMSACCIFTDKLINLVDRSKVMKFGKVLNDDPVLIRDENGDEVYFTGDDYTTMCKQVNNINKWLDKHSFNFGIFEKKIHIHRVFNTDLNTGGRFYFGEAQTIKSYKRKSFIFDGEPVSEIDFSSQHFSILACKSNYILPEDFKPYDIDISDLLTMQDGYDKGKARAITKLGCMMLINSGNPSKSLSNVWQQNIDAITKLLDEGRWKEAKENPFYGVSGKKYCSIIINRLQEHNSYAKEYFRHKSGMWGELQRLDSEIMLNILLFMKKHDAPCLPYHDSAVVRKSDVVLLEEAMRFSWKKVLETEDNFRITRKY